MSWVVVELRLSGIARVPDFWRDKQGWSVECSKELLTLRAIRKLTRDRGSIAPCHSCKEPSNRKNGRTTRSGGESP